MEIRTTTIFASSGIIFGILPFDLLRSAQSGWLTPDPFRRVPRPPSQSASPN
ncbi:hypothetical protein BU26DRAFT_520569 [Trematosphaeria pertusa]|uniref:Uncharacterized protein n=1 Tax=Trematosphaeria pertusa TaxID=390896 RepID=A0A6A6IAI4_9PLEO|nr:uncharacterized protein BU26DRAFT_520569 [Trematosphaeria pertusa]KAF2247391.1 hypothetical protein BU26DRAFT_520569 [Trematosphaeria pertusa]